MATSCRALFPALMARAATTTTTTPRARVTTAGALFRSSSSSSSSAAFTARTSSSPSSHGSRRRHHRRRDRGYVAVVAASSSAAKTTAPAEGGGGGGGVVDKEAHNIEQAALRDEMVAGCTECTMPMESDRAVTLAGAALNGRTAADLGEGSSLRVLVVGAETGKLAAALAASGASHVLVIDHSQVMLDRAAEAFDSLGTVGNEQARARPINTRSFPRIARLTRAQLRRRGPCTLVAPYQGPFDAVVFNHTLASQADPADALRRATLLTRPGTLPGYWRGSKQMGVPTANLDPEVLETELSAMHKGVYFGYARLPGDPKHAAWCKCVVNVGQRPTFADGDGVTVEVHALRDFGRDFYGEAMEVVVVGYLRPEMRFDGLPALVAGPSI